MLGCVKMTGRGGEGRRVRVSTPPDATAPTVYIHTSILARGALDVTQWKRRVWGDSVTCGSHMGVLLSFN